MVVVALALRLIVMGLLFRLQLDPARDHFAFGFETGRIARSLASGQGFSSPFPEPTGPTAILAPVYPGLLAGVFRLFGIYSTASALAILSLNDLFSALTCLPVFFIADKTFGRREATWAGWAWAFFPYAVGIPNLWVWETSLTALLLSLLLLATLHLERSAQLTAWLGYGLLWGFVVLTNLAVLSGLPFLWAWIWCQQQRRGLKCGRLVGVAAVAFLCSVTPWLVRNAHTFGHFVFFRNNFGLQFCMGNNDDTSKPGSDNLFPSDNPVEMEKVRRMGESAYMAEKGHQALAFLAGQPGRFAWLTFRRILCVWTALWGLHPSWRFGDEFGVPNILSYTTITLLALLGLRRAIRDRSRYAVPLGLLLAFFPIVYYVTYPDVRYRHPIDPEIVILAVYGVSGYFSTSSRESLARPKRAGHSGPPVGLTSLAWLEQDSPASPQPSKGSTDGMRTFARGEIPWHRLPSRRCHENEDRSGLPDGAGAGRNGGGADENLRHRTVRQA